jgi:periplasmic divalent cation tolerance protein
VRELGDSTDTIVVLVTTETKEQAKEIAKKLLELKLIACANLIPNIESVYTWEGKVEESMETMMILKVIRLSFSASLSVITLRNCSHSVVY